MLRELGVEFCHGCTTVGLQRLIECNIVIPTGDAREIDVRELERVLSLSTKRRLHERHLDRGIRASQRHELREGLSCEAYRLVMRGEKRVAVLLPR